MALTLPPDSIIEAIHGPVTRVTRRIDIYQPDRTTLWRSNVGFLDGSVNIDATRDERRTCDLVLENENNSLQPRPHANFFWYDKIVKVFRGVHTAAGATWEQQLGEFRIDGFRMRHNTSEMAVKLRDHTKTLLESKFPTSTLFPANHPIEEIVRAIAVSAGFSAGQLDLPLTGANTSREYLFEQEQQRWAAIKEVCTAYNYEVYFTDMGILTMRHFQDPFTTPASYTFRTGQLGNLVEYNKEATDARLRNHIVATGESASSDTPPVWGEVANTNVNSPTSIQRVGRRSEFYKSSLIETQQQAIDVATRFLKVMGLEQFDIDLGAIVVPYMDAGVIVEFLDPNPAPNDPSKYLLQGATIPLKLGPMTAKAGRVINIGN